MKKKYTSTNLLPQKAGSPSVQLRPQRKGAILRQIPLPPEDPETQKIKPCGAAFCGPIF